MVSVTITPEDVVAAIAVSPTAAQSSTQPLSNSQSLDLTTVLKDMSFNGMVKGLEQVDMATDTAANVVNQAGHNYAVYTGTSDPSAQLLIDQHMLQSHQTS